MNKRLIGIMSALVVTGSLFVGCSTGYQYDQEFFDRGKEAFASSLGSETVTLTDYAEGFFSLCEFIGPGREDELVYSTPNDSQKQNDDMVYGTLVLVAEKLDAFPTMEVEEMIKDFRLNEASTEDMKEFQRKVTPYYTELSVEIKKALSNPEFNGTIPKENYDKILNIGEDLQVYYDRYFDKVIEYKH